ncbi:MAG: ABC transporter ATP-binding protein [Chloroflexota bacterium]
MAEKPPLLQVKNLKTHFHTRDGVVKAVDGISFDLREGEALGIVGESGSGKSVSALSIMRLIPRPPGVITADKVLFEGKDLMTLDDEGMRKIRGAKIAMIFQDPMTSLNPVLTIGRQIGEALELHMGMNGDQARKRSAELLQMVGIPSAKDRLDDYPHQFSGGMRQRVMIAMALSCNPRVLIADEPTTALDVTIQAQIIDLVRRLRQETGAAVLWITHDLGIVAGLCDRVNVMYAGRIVETAPVRDIYYRPSHGYTMGLLTSIPRVDDTQHRRLVPIDGAPPDLIDLPALCPFLPRCRFAADICGREAPPNREVAPGHFAVCWVDIPAAVAASRVKEA